MCYFLLGCCQRKAPRENSKSTNLEYLKDQVKNDFFLVEPFNFIQINGLHQKYNIIKPDNSNCECLIRVIIAMHPRSGVHGAEIFRNLDNDLPSKTSRMVQFDKSWLLYLFHCFSKTLNWKFFIKFLDRPNYLYRCAWVYQNFRCEFHTLWL